MGRAVSPPPHLCIAPPSLPIGLGQGEGSSQRGSQSQVGTMYLHAGPILLPGHPIPEPTRRPTMLPQVPKGFREEVVGFGVTLELGAIVVHSIPLHGMEGVPGSESGLLRTDFFPPGTSSVHLVSVIIPIAVPIPSHRNKCLRANLRTSPRFPRALEKRQRIGLNVGIQIGVISR